MCVNEPRAIPTWTCEALKLHLHKCAQVAIIIIIIFYCAMCKMTSCGRGKLARGASSYRKKKRWQFMNSCVAKMLGGKHNKKWKKQEISGITQSWWAFCCKTHERFWMNGNDGTLIDMPFNDVNFTHFPLESIYVLNNSDIKLTGIFFML